jgi:hypothetical protein
MHNLMMQCLYFLLSIISSLIHDIVYSLTCTDMYANVSLCTCNIEQLVKVVVIKENCNSKARKKNKKLKKKRKGGRQKPTCLTGITRQFSLC